MSWLADLLRTKTTSWTFGRIEADGMASSAPRAIPPETSYLSIVLRSLRVPYARRGLSQFYGTVSSRCSVVHRGGGRAEFFVVTTPPNMQGVDDGDTNRILLMNKRLAGPVPYRGGDVELQLALLSVKASDLSAPYLEVLESVASLAGVAFVAPALMLAAPLRRGLDLLVGASEPATLQIGLAATFLSPEAGLYCLIAAPKGDVDLSSLHVDDTFELLHDDGRPLTEHAYLVVSIAAQERRDDWPELPGLRDAHQDLVRAVEKADFAGVKDALGAFRRVAVTSPDLLAVDGARLADMMSKEVSLALGAVPTALGARPAIRPLEEFDLYPCNGHVG